MSDRVGLLPPEQKCNVEWGFQPLKPGKLASVLPLSESKKSKTSPEPLVHPKKRVLCDHLQHCFKRRSRAALNQPCLLVITPDESAPSRLCNSSMVKKQQRALMRGAALR
ncbi:MAG: hypothetical protein KME45_19745 [Stenomitos rutilans HA7619-LM2]|nr:hypothetical protein [Stenomitos rutilans HA7619-LM2]